MTVERLMTIVNRLGARIEFKMRLRASLRQVVLPSPRVARRPAHRLAPAAAIAYAIGQPDEVDVSELIVRPTASPY